MRLIIAGSRSIKDLNVVLLALLDSGFDPSVIVSGGANGVDSIGEEIANMLGLPIDRYPISSEDWELHGHSAGPIRNTEMAKNADALLAVWDGKSNGTRDMIKKAEQYGLPVHVHRLDDIKDEILGPIDL